MKKTAIVVLTGFILSVTPVAGNSLVDLSVQASTDASTAQQGASANLTIATYVILALGVTSSIVLSVVATANIGKSSAAEDQVMYFMKANHSNLTTDFAEGKGYFFKDVAAQIGLTPEESASLSEGFEGTVFQKDIIASLSDEIDRNDARLFADSVSRYIVEKIGIHRSMEVFSSVLSL